jgi:iron complex outermembrane receptor protein
VQVGGEEAIAYELGLKSELFDQKVRANIAAFYTDYKNRIVPIGGTECQGAPALPTDPGAIIDSDGNVCFAVTSLTSYQQLTGEITGAELELWWLPVENFSINGVIGYTNWSSPEVDNCDLNLDGVPDTGVVCNDATNFVPEYNWTVGAAYDIPMTSGAMLTPRIDVYGQTEICSSFASQLSCAEGYELVNIRLQWSSPEDKWSVAVGATNVTDEEYYLNIFDLTLFGQNTVEGQPGHPAEWYMTFRRNFQ